jgi:hypothetical protein
MSPLDLWHKQLDLVKYAQNAPTKKQRLYREELIMVSEYPFPKITTEVDGKKIN